MQSKIIHKAYSYLSRREYYRQELEQKLIRGGYSPDDVKEVLDQLEGENKLSDERYIESFIHSYQKKLYGRNWIYMRLAQKGFDDHQINCIIDNQKIDWQENIRVCYNKRQRLQVINDTKSKIKLKHYLYRKGYSVEEIKNLLKE